MLSAKVLKYPKVARPDVSSIPYINIYLKEFLWVIFVTAAAAAKSLQLCLTLCDPIDGSQPDSPVPGILQARTLE